VLARPTRGLLLPSDRIYPERPYELQAHHNLRKDAIVMAKRLDVRYIDSDVVKNRTALLTVRVTPEEMTMVKELAEADGISASDFVRLFVRRAHSERFGSKSRAKPKPKRK
jgi:hypothetical protein